MRGSYIREFQRYAISNQALADLSLRDDLIALGLDPKTGTGTGTLSSFDVDFDRNTSAQPLDPRQGYATFFHLEHAGGGLGGDFRYDELMMEGRQYQPFGDRLVWANRARFGTLTSDLEGFAKRFGKPAAGSVHVEGQATGPASDMQFAGKFEGSRLKYGSSVDALALNGTYTGHLPDLDVSRVAVDATATGRLTVVGPDISGSAMSGFTTA